MGYVVPTSLATAAEYADWTQTTPPPTIELTLRACTTLVLGATRSAVYTTDTAGKPTDTGVRDALRDAVCIQAAAWVKLGIDPTSGGVAGSSRSARSKKLGSASIDYDTADAATTATARAKAYTSLVPEAVTYLQQRGLISTAPWVIG